MPASKRKTWAGKSIRDLRPRELDGHRTFKVEERPIAGPILPFWPFNRTRIVEMPIPSWRLRPEDPER